MIETKTTTVRLPVSLVAALTNAANQNSNSLNKEIELRLAASIKSNQPIILGWVKLDRWGELDRDEVCDECGQDLQPNDAYVGLVASGGFHGLVCGGCATSE